ncbi:UpxY family transcription antiterminator [Croceimicrobium sp.]|uniref:UpxY family transcription antiterminator n=1 Tax=Croceimicrobium sp. TaxID=2828340 RepID=UPI003BA994FF
MQKTSSAPAHWYALYTKPRAEKKVAERLKAKGCQVYAPTQTVIKQWSDRKKKIEEPFFKSYVFVRFELKDKFEVLNTPGVVAQVTWLGKAAEIREEEIDAIRDFLQAYQGVSIEQIDFEAGQKLRIKHGELEDAYGTVVRQNKHRVVLEIEKLGMALYAEVPKSQVENIER